MKQGWEYKKLGEVATPSIGMTYKPDNVVDNGVIVLRSGNIQDSNLAFEDIVRIDLDIPEDKLVRDGDILMCSRNGSFNLVGKVALISRSSEPMTYGAFMTIIRSEYNPFLFYFFKSRLFREKLVQGKTSTVNQITVNMLKGMIIPVPPLTTQQSIVSELDTLSQIIADYKEQLADYDKLEQSIFYDMFGDPVKNEKGWEVKTIGDVCRLKSGNSNANNSKSGDLPYVKVSDMNMKENEDAITISSTYVDRNENKNSIFPIGTTIFPKRGGAIFTNKKRITKVEICCDLNTMGVIPQKEVMPIYIYQFFRNFDLSTLCNGAAIPQLNNCDVNPIKLCVPPLPLQQQFASKIESIEQMKADTKAALQDAELLFQSRMDYWFNA